MKTKKTLLKRVKITKNGKILKKQNNNGHLSRKNSANKGHRKDRLDVVESKGYKSIVKAMLSKHGKNIK